MLELFRKYKTLILAGALLLVALLFYSANLREREKTTLFEKMVLQLASPFQQGIDRGWESLTGIWDHYIWLVESEKQNELLRLENRRLQAQIDELREIRLANDRLRRLLEFRDEIDLPALPAQIIAEDASSWFRTVTIDKGSESGVREGMPVVVAEGAVGRVIRTGSRHARVLLVTDASSAVASLVQRSRTRGISRGRGDSLTFDFALRQEEIVPGDRIVSSGTGGVFPKGLAVGEVVRVERGEYGLFQTVEVEPSVDFSRLEEVLVLLKEEP